MAPIRPHKKQAAPKVASSNTSLPSKLAKNPRLPATMFTAKSQGPVQPAQASGSGSGVESVSTMAITNDDEDSTAGTGSVKKSEKDKMKMMIPEQVGIAKSKKAGKTMASRKSRLKAEAGRERALEKEAVLRERVKGREERKAKRNRAKQAWE